ncbi:MAG TPA: hypothetical protein VKH18_08285 [Terriglobales bacterium]|nr:hypothetical protein [Terriglobales bacterium]
MRLSGSIGKIAAVMALALTLSAALAHAQNEVVPWDFPDFSATQVLQANVDIPMKVNRAGTSVRMERSAAWSTLYTPFKIYNLTSYPDGSHQCVVLRPEQVKMLPSPLELLNGTKVERTPAGTGVFEGHPCKIEKVVVTRPDGRTVEATVWEAQDLKGVPVKIETQLPPHHYTAIYRDIVLGTPDKALFTPPDKCTPYEKMGQVVEKISK